jgi:integrase
MGLGSVKTISLATARDLTRAAREQVRRGVDPIDARGATRSQARLDAAKAITFKDAAEAYIESSAGAWSNAKQAPQWRASLETYAFPLLGPLPVQGIDTDLVSRVLRPIWLTKPETASRVRRRIERILGSAIALGQRPGPNPARLRDNLDTVLPTQPNRRTRVRNFPALPYVEIGAFMVALRGEDCVAGKALRFAILTAVRTSEVIGLEWPEIDFDAALWTIPAAKIKARREHRIPLAKDAIAILREMHKLRSDDTGHVFPGARAGSGLSTGALLMLLKRMDRSNVTTHGFRSTFRDFAAEMTSFPNIVAEAALAHSVSDATEAAYRRGDLLEKRKQLMDAWARYCAAPAAAAKGKVVSIGRGKK